MKHCKVGDILSVTSGIVVHGCNAQGVMGSGLAKQVKEKFPTAFDTYIEQLEWCKASKSDPLGRVSMALILPAPGQYFVIANAITQRFYGRDKNVVYVDYAAVEEVFKFIANTMNAGDIKELHYPLIGAGFANGDWKIIEKIIDDAFEPYPEIERTLWTLE